MSRIRTAAQSTRYLTVASGRPFSGASQWGYRASVEADDTVRVYDDIAGHFTACHSLTPQQLSYVRRRAAAGGAR